MTAEQLQQARASAWRHDGNPLLTAEDAAAWLRATAFALFLPRPAQVAAPAGSFLEATIGKAHLTPPPQAIENATGLLRRLLHSGDVLALNLLGIPGDQPDFLATEETLPFLFALRGDREWQRGPRGKSSPLVVEVWKLLSRDGAMSADEIKDKLGRHLTESAALRALTDLWTNLRIEPVYSAEQGTQWQLLEANHEKAMTAGSAMAQGMALSALVSLYLQSAVAATGEEVESFLAPVASRSRVRDAVRGLLATRQLGVRNLGADEHFFVEGSLPEFGEHTGELARQERRTRTPAVIADMLPEVAAPAEIVTGDLRIEALSESENERERTIGEGRKRFVAQRSAGTGDRKGFAGRPGADRKSDGGPGKSFGERKSFGRGPASSKGEGAPRKPFFAREPWKEDRKPAAPGVDAGERRPSRPAAGDAARPFAPRGDRKSFSGAGGARPFRKDGERKPFAPRSDGESGERPPRKPFAAREGGDRPFSPREGSGPYAGAGTRKPFAPREGGQSFAGGADRKPFGARPGGRPASAGDRKPFVPREGRSAAAGTDRKPFPPREGGSSYGAAGGRKPFAPRGGGRPSDDGARKPFTPREGAAPGRRTFTPREGSDTRRPFTPRDGAATRPFPPREGAGTPRRTGTPGGAPPKRFSSSEGRPARPGAPSNSARPGGKRPRTAPFTSTGKPRAGVGATGRPGPRSARPGKPPSGRKPGAGPRKPGGKGPSNKGPRRDA